MLNDYKYAIGTAKQAGNYNKITNYLILHIRKTYKNGEDIANVIANQEPFNFYSSPPKLKILTTIVTMDTSPAEKLEIKHENDQYRIEYKAELQLHLKQKSYFCTDLGKAYTFLFGQCTTGLQHRIEAKTKYKSKIKGNHKKLLEMINKNSLSFAGKKKANIVIINAIMNLMTTRQKDNEDLTNYTRCFKVVRDLCKEKYGGIFEIPMLAKKESTWTSDKEAATREHMPVSYPSCISRIWIK